MAMCFLWFALVLVLKANGTSLHWNDVRFIAASYKDFRLWHAYSAKAAASMAIAIWMIWTAIKSGGTVLRKILPSAELSILEKRVFSTALGLVTISMATLVLGAVGLWYPSVFWFVLVAATIAYFPKKRFPLSWHKQIPTVTPLQEWWVKGAFGLLSIAALILLVGDLAPETFYDALHYHLGVPSLYSLNHRIYNEPNFAYASFIMVVQLFWGFALTVGNEITVKLLHGAMTILLFFAFVAFERRYLAKGAGLLGTLLFISMPLVGVNAAAAGIDVASSVLQFLAVFALIRALVDEHDDTSATEWTRLAGLLNGVAATCRYTCLPAIPIGCFLIVWNRRKQRSEWSTVFKQQRVFLIYAALAMLPFYVKNIVFHDNPVYPVGGMTWGVPRIAIENWTNIMNATLPPHLSGAASLFEVAARFFREPWLITLQGKDASQDFVGPILLGLLPLLLLRQRGGASGLLAAYSSFLWVTWLLTNTVHIRFGMPLLAILSILLADSVLSVPWPALLRHAMLALCLFGAGWNLYYTFLVTGYKEGWRVVGGMVSEYDYLATGHYSYPSPDYQGLVWMNNNLPAESKVMMAGDARTFYTRFPVVPASVFNTEPIVLVARNARNGDDMAKLLHEEGVTHLFLNFAEAVRGEAYGNFSWDKHSWTVFDDFWQHHVRLIWSSIAGGPAPEALLVYQFDSDFESAEMPSHAAPPNLFERWKPKE
jgi:hypothetical protein